MTSIRSRLTAGLALIILFFVAQAALVWWGQDNARRDVVDATRKNTVASSQLSELAVLAQQIRRYEKEYFVYVSNRERRDGYTKEWNATADKMGKLLENIRANPDKAFTGEDVAAVTTWTQAADFYNGEMRRIFELVNAQPSAPTTSGSLTVTPTALSPIEVNGMITAGKDRFSGVLIKGVSTMAAEKTKQTLGLAELASNRFNQLLTAVLVTVAVGILVALGLIFTLPKAVSGPLAQLTEAVDQISKGKVDQKVTVANIAEFDGLSQALERLRLGQQALIARLRR